MKLLLISDLHEMLPRVEDIPQVDWILFGGDFAFRERWDWKSEREMWKDLYLPWLGEIQQRGIKTCAIAGNHDSFPAVHTGAISVYFDEYLENTTCMIGDKLVYGSPYTLPFKNWAFSMEEEFQQLIFKRAPKADIVINHGPPYGILDRVESELTGSKAFLDYCYRTKPELVIFGHIHPGYGSVIRGKTQFINVSWASEYRKDGYKCISPRNEFIIWDTETKEISIHKI